MKVKNRSSMAEVLHTRISAKDLYEMLHLDWSEEEELAWDLKGVTHFCIVPINNAECYPEYFQPDFHAHESEIHVQGFCSHEAVGDDELPF